MVWLRIPMQAETHAAPRQIYFLTSDAKQFCVSMQFALEEDLKKKKKNKQMIQDAESQQYHSTRNDFWEL